MAASLFAITQPSNEEAFSAKKKKKRAPCGHTYARGSGGAASAVGAGGVGDPQSERKGAARPPADRAAHRVVQLRVGGPVKRRGRIRQLKRPKSSVWGGYFLGWMESRRGVPNRGVLKAFLLPFGALLAPAAVAVTAASSVPTAGSAAGVGVGACADASGGVERASVGSGCDSAGSFSSRR